MSRPTEPDPNDTTSRSGGPDATPGPGASTRSAGAGHDGAPFRWSDLVRPVPDDDLEPARLAASKRALRILWGAIALLVLYGSTAGFFQGGWQLLRSAVKAPLVVLFTLALCLPSLYIFRIVAGDDVAPRQFAGAALSFLARLAVLLVAFVPIVWLFSVSSRYLFWIGFLHWVLWLVALGVAASALRPAASPRAGTATAFWVLLAFVVSLQVATFFRPVLLQEPGTPWFDDRKAFFLEHVADSVDARSPDGKHRQEAARKTPPSQEEPGDASSSVGGARVYVPAD